MSGYLFEGWGRSRWGDRGAASTSQSPHAAGPNTARRDARRCRLGISQRSGIWPSRINLDYSRADAVQGFKKLFSLVKSSPQGAAIEDRTLIDMLSTAIDVIVPFQTYGDVYEVGEIWLAADARRRGETVAGLLDQH